MLAALDIAIIAIYALALFGIAQWVSREEVGHAKNAKDFFLAGGKLPWWAIGASLIAANISAEQIIGMSGSGYAIGLAIASYEWLAAITLIIVGKFLLPIFLKHEIYTMPQFLEQRFDRRVRVLMATFWIAVYIFVNLTAVLWLGALAANTVGGIDLNVALFGLGAFALAYSLYGGLRAVALTDIIQVVLLIAGGLIIVVILLDKIAQGQGLITGMSMIMDAAPEKFDMILSKDSPHYMSLPGLSVILGGMWVMHFSYWGFNQYIIQRALAAKSLKEAQKGILFAAGLKVILPIIVVLPGIALFVLNSNLDSPDQAYPTAMTLLPVGLKGLAFAALLAAIVSSLASMVNSVSTLFVVDIYPSLKRDAKPEQAVGLGRIVSIVAMLIAMISAQPLLGKFEQAFQYIQEFTGFFTPGIVVIFVLGIFWRNTNATGALIAAASSVVLSLLLKVFMPELPFIDRVGAVFILSAVLAIGGSLLEGKEQHNAIVLGEMNFVTSRSFNVAAIGITLIIASFYVLWW